MRRSRKNAPDGDLPIYIIPVDEPRLLEIDWWMVMLRALEDEIERTKGKSIMRGRAYCPVYWYARGVVPNLPNYPFVTKLCVRNKLEDYIRELKRRYGLNKRKRKPSRSGWEEDAAAYQHAPTRMGLFPHAQRVRYHYRDVFRKLKKRT